MAESEEKVAFADYAVSTSSEAVASTRTASETHYNIRNSWVFFAIFYSIELLSNTSIG